ncbi:MAG: hypothetical protein N4A36_03800 [Candidatus Gracilibacteria bacterium]|jgi:hypothetical protein|nr:hypothetical protein [Candidatus Gracilibacteria bacterium]
MSLTPGGLDDRLGCKDSFSDALITKDNEAFGIGSDHFQRDSVFREIVNDVMDRISDVIEAFCQANDRMAQNGAFDAEIYTNSKIAAIVNSSDYRKKYGIEL